MNKQNYKLSVVIASVNGPAILDECLQNLHRQSGVGDIEIIVANRYQNGLEMMVREKYPSVNLIEAPTQTTVPQLRALAFKKASGNSVAVIEDHCMVETNWAQRMIEAQEGEYPVIGGSIENAARERLVDWAAFFCEYSQAMKPMPEGKVDFIPGNNVSYRRWVLERFWHDIEDGVWDFILHEHIRDAHIPLYSIPSITIHHKMSGSLPWFMMQKFHFARSFAGMRFSSPSRVRRAFYALGALLLPLILARRTVSCVWKKGKHRRELLVSSPILMVLLLSWGLGEAVGYIFGAGSSSAKVA